MSRIEAAIRAATDGLSMSNVGLLSQEQRILHVDTKMSDRVLNLGVPKQDLDGADIASRLVIIDGFVRRSE
jgi:hypothetical protein